MGRKLALPVFKRNMKAKAFVNALLVLIKEDHILLLLRKNTGYADGFYGLVSGHVEENESAIQAMVREAYEEAGIRILPENLHLVHTMHSQSNRINISLFFTCTKWEGDIVNNEPDKCETLAFFPINNLPENTIDAIAHAIRCIQNQEIYSEMGWDAIHSCHVPACGSPS